MAGLNTPKRVIRWFCARWGIILGAIIFIFAIPTLCMLFAGSFIVEEQAPDEQALDEVIVSALVGWPSFRTKEIISIRWGIWISAFVVFGVPAIMTVVIDWLIERNGKKTTMNIMQLITERDEITRSAIYDTLLNAKDLKLKEGTLDRDTSAKLADQIMIQLQETTELFLDGKIRRVLQRAELPEADE